MSNRAFWTGTINFGLVNVPVGVYSAVVGTEEALKDLCTCCHEPFTQSFECPKGSSKEDGVVKGLAVGDDWVVIDPDKLKRPDPESKEMISVEFIHPESMPLHVVTGFYGLKIPSKVKGADKPFALLHRVLVETGAVAVGRWTARSRERMVVIRPVGDALTMATFAYAEQVRELTPIPSKGIKSISQAEVDAGIQLVTATIKDFDHASYIDEDAAYQRKVIDAAIEGTEVVHTDPGKVESLDLAAVLKASLEAAR